MANRFYQVEFPNRPAYWEDIGTNLHITGVVFEGHGVPVVAMLPHTSCDQDGIKNAKQIRPTDTEWSEIIQYSDDPRIFVLDPTGTSKIMHRKVRFTVSGAIQQKIWVRDGLKCMYCNAEMGRRPLTVDHFMPLDLGGENNTSNYLTACSKCNKKKGNQHPEDFLSPEQYKELVDYLREQKDLEWN